MTSSHPHSPTSIYSVHSHLSQPIFANPNVHSMFFKPTTNFANSNIPYFEQNFWFIVFSNSLTYYVLYFKLSSGVLSLLQRNFCSYAPGNKCCNSHYLFIHIFFNFGGFLAHFHSGSFMISSFSI